MLSNKEIKIAKALVDGGYLSKNVLLRITQEVKDSGKSLYDILIEKNFCDFFVMRFNLQKD